MENSRQDSSIFEQISVKILSGNAGG